MGDRQSLAAGAVVPPVLEGAPWPAPAPLNYDQPAGVPVRPQGNIPVIARLLWSTHEELVPARAIRWTPTHVMVMVKDPGAAANADEVVAWLRADDVYRTLPRRPRPSSAPAT